MVILHNYSNNSKVISASKFYFLCNPILSDDYGVFKEYSTNKIFTSKWPYSILTLLDHQQNSLWELDFSNHLASHMTWMVHTEMKAYIQELIYENEYLKGRVLDKCKSYHSLDRRNHFLHISLLSNNYLESSELIPVPLIPFLVSHAENILGFWRSASPNILAYL